MVTYHSFRQSEIENMIPFERDLYSDMILEKLNRHQQQGMEQAFG